MIVTIKDFGGSIALKSSPYDVSVKRISKLDLKSAYFDSVICSSVPPEAGTLLRIPIYIPASGLASKISLSVVPFSSVLEEQKFFLAIMLDMSWKKVRNTGTVYCFASYILTVL